jgi:hypothetical protein
VVWFEAWFQFSNTHGARTHPLCIHKLISRTTYDYYDYVLLSSGYPSFLEIGVTSDR